MAQKHVVFVLSNQTVNSSGTVTSDMFNTEHGVLRGMYYQLANTSTGVYVAGSIRYLVAADTSAEFVLPIDTAAGAQSLLFGTVNSNNRYVAFRPNDVPYAPMAQVRFISTTDNAVTLAGIYMVYQEGPTS